MSLFSFIVCAFNRTVSKVHDFLQNEAKGRKIVGAESLEEMVKLLKPPRRIVLLVKAGSAVQAFIDGLVPLLAKDDIIIDGGNSEYHDSNRRSKELAAKGIHFVGCGVSGGEEGARYGPSLMPGGAPQAWPHIKPIFQAIAAKADGEPCCDWWVQLMSFAWHFYFYIAFQLGEAGSGHFVKNGRLNYYPKSQTSQRSTKFL